jgi:hypothetical protein
VQLSRNSFEEEQLGRLARGLCKTEMDSMGIIPIFSSLKSQRDIFIYNCYMKIELPQPKLFITPHFECLGAATTVNQVLLTIAH